MAAVTSLCSRAIYLDHGSYAADGDANEIVQLYLSRSTSNASIDLAERTDRGGNGVVRVQSLSITNESGAALDTIVSGQDVIVQVEYTIPSGRSIENGVCILVFKTQLGQSLFTCSTRLSNQYVRFVSNRNLKCRIPHFPLNQGGYYLDVYLKQGNDSRDVLDSVENAVEFQVVFGDFFGSGRAVFPQSSPVLVEHEWIGDGAS